VCPAKASDFAAFPRTLISALRIIAKRSPTSRMFLVSQFGSPQTWWKAASPKQRKAFGGTGQCASIDPWGGFVPNGNRRLEHSIHGYEG
jgi:hypothetical protein